MLRLSAARLPWLRDIAARLRRSWTLSRCAPSSSGSAAPASRSTAASSAPVGAGPARPPRRRRRATARTTPTGWPARSRGCGSSTTATGKFDRSVARHRRRGARREPVHAARGHARRATDPASRGAARPELAEPLYERFCEALRDRGRPGRRRVSSAAQMQVELVNDGPGDDHPRHVGSPAGAFAGRDPPGASLARHRCYPLLHRISRLDEMGARRPFLLRRHGSDRTRRARSWPT